MSLWYQNIFGSGATIVYVIKNFERKKKIIKIYGDLGKPKNGDKNFDK